MGEDALSAHLILDALAVEQVPAAISELRNMVERLYGSIPAEKRISRGITWVVERAGLELAEANPDDDDMFRAAVSLFESLPLDDRLLGVPIFLAAIYGQNYAIQVFDFFESIAASPDWVVKEFAAGAFRKVIAPNKEIVLPWLHEMSVSPDPNRRRFVAETLRPVTSNRWIFNQPDYSLSLLRHLFREAHPFPRTSVGNNLSDLSRRLPEMVISVVAELLELKDKHSTWIATRACRNLVKRDPQRIMNLLNINEYHYKDRNYYREPG